MNFESLERDFTLPEKFSAFAKHVYMCVFGPILEPEAYKQYMTVFHEFLEYRNKSAVAKTPTETGSGN